MPVVTCLSTAFSRIAERHLPQGAGEGGVSLSRRAEAGGWWPTWTFVEHVRGAKHCLKHFTCPNSLEWGRAQREGDTESETGPGSELSAQSPTRGSNSRTVRSWPEPKADAQSTEPPRSPNNSTWIIRNTCCYLQGKYQRNKQTNNLLSIIKKLIEKKI